MKSTTKLVSVDVIDRTVSRAIDAAEGALARSPLIPCMVGGHLCERAFLYGANPGRKSRPYATVLVSSENGLLLEYRNAYAGDFADGEKFPLEKPMSYAVPHAKTADEQGELLKKLGELYREVRTFAFETELPDDKAKTLSRYADCLADTVPAELLGFMRETEKPFFTWIGSVKS